MSPSTSTDPVQLFDDGGTLVGTFDTIQAAVDAASDGDTILVTDGIYVEQVQVDGFAGLTIVAADGADVTIQAPADLVETAQSSTGREAHAVLTVENSTNVVIEGIDIDGAGRGNTVDEGTGPGQANFYGIFYRNASGGLVDVDIAHVHDPVLNGVQRGVGLGVDNDSLMAFSMTGGSITDFQKNATVFNGADLDISGVTVTGAGSTALIAQNGFQVTNSTGSISGNTVTGFGYTGANVATGVLAYGNTDLDITNNIIVGANIDSTDANVVGIYVTDFGQPSSGGVISGNTISFTDVGIGVYDTIQPNGILVENNTITDVDFTESYAAGVELLPDPLLTTTFDVDGSDEADILSGAAGNDNLSGLGGDDLFDGNGGDDTLAGGSGIDTATYDGVRAGYDISVEYDGNGRAIGFSAVDDTNAGNGDDGDDGLTSIEKLVFADMTLDLADPVQLMDENGDLVATFDTIQAAVDAAEDDYTVLVAAGTYAETVIVDNDITILGPNAGVPGTGARGAEAIIDGPVYMHADGATLDGMTVLGGGTVAGVPTGIYVDVDNVTLTNLVLEGDGTVDIGITTLYGGGITGLVLSDSLVTGWGQGTYFNPVTQFSATGNSFDDNGNAIVGDDWGVGTIISNNSFTNSVGSHIGYGSFDSIEDMAVYFGPGNAFGGTNRAVSVFTYGDGDAGGQVIYGTEYADGLNGSEFIAGSDNDNEFHGRGGDDRLTGNSGNDTLDGGTGDDVLRGGTDTDTATYVDAIGVDDLATVADADPFTVGNQAGWTVTSATEGTDLLTGVEIVSSASGNILLVGSGGFTTIQAAIDAASDGDTILVAAGTYDEDLNIHVGVTILGAQYGEAVGGRDASGGTGETTIVGDAEITATGDVTLDGLRFLNDATTTGGGGTSPTLQILTDGHTVTNSIFWSTVTGGTADDRAIMINPILGGTLTITDNLISGTQHGQFSTASWGRGIWFDGGGVALVVSGNTIEWARTGLNLEMSGSSTADLSGQPAAEPRHDGLGRHRRRRHHLFGQHRQQCRHRVQLPQPDRRHRARRRRGDRHPDPGRRYRRPGRRPRRLGQRHPHRHRPATTSSTATTTRPSRRRPTMTCSTAAAAATSCSAGSATTRSTAAPATTCSTAAAMMTR